MHLVYYIEHIIYLRTEFVRYVIFRNPIYHDWEIFLRYNIARGFIVRKEA